MRLLEAAGIAGLLLCTPHLFFPAVGPEGVFAFVLCVSTLTIACHAWFEGYRWQMAPAYLLGAGLVLYEWIYRS